MRSGAARRNGAAALAAALLAAAAPAAADWIVMRDGARMETRGLWEVRGALVVFTSAAGNLSSVRLADADLDASKAATEAAAHPPQPAPEPAEKKPVLVLTDADVRHVEDTDQPAAPPTSPATAAPRPTSETPASAGAPAASAAPAAEVQRIQVREWHQDLDASESGATLVGEITNNSADFVQDIKILAALYDESGKLVANAAALIGAAHLDPGQSTNFRVTFPGVFTYANAKFEISSYAFKTTAGRPSSE